MIVRLIAKKIFSYIIVIITLSRYVKGVRAKFFKHIKFTSIVWFKSDIEGLPETGYQNLEAGGTCLIMKKI